MMDKKTVIEGNIEVYLAEPTKIPYMNEKDFVGRDYEIKLCMAAWNMENMEPEGKSPRYELIYDQESPPLHFRLEGPPGSGKNEIVYQLARKLGKQHIYVIQGHEELCPEDLALTIVPRSSEKQNGKDAPLVLRASPLTTAMIEGQICFIDEINRAPEKALSPLSSVLDGRGEIFSAITGAWVRPSDEAKRNFRFCCSLNPNIGNDLPEYLDQRTLPIVKIAPPEIKDLCDIIRLHTKSDGKLMQIFESWYEKVNPDLSARQAIVIMSYAKKLIPLETNPKTKIEDAFCKAVDSVFRRKGNE